MPSSSWKESLCGRLDADVSGFVDCDREPGPQKLGALAFGKDVKVEWNKRDRYGRTVGKVWVESPDAPCRGKPGCPKTLDVGLAQLTQGLAWWYRTYANEQSPEDQGRYEHAEFGAKIRRSGLWSEKNPTPPWEWRHRQ